MEPQVVNQEVVELVERVNLHHQEVIVVMVLLMQMVEVQVDRVLDLAVVVERLVVSH